MDFDFRFTIPADRQVLWQKVTDIETVAFCVPGVTGIEKLEEGPPVEYEGTLKIRVGPIGLQMKGLVIISSIDNDQCAMALICEGKDRKIPGTIKTETTMGLEATESGEPGTDLVIHTHATIMGKLGEFGQSVIRKKTAKVLAEFVANLVTQLEEEAAA
ncbi:MAG: hypothetical protein DRQ60_01945 [Gammaproteobacteria bacterium]|nr:MAG: hypothetical protein DRQ54_01250 [Gammaproteobacteria bacterium]RLA15950.1 MAG: hypothetical protein DRQ52_00580 [Gammaproteobacteria bacterium]RLA17461.1 MAG: hypothetical protein DRQ60_01945 [Gammaproteobacteria bacterium]